MGLFLIITLLSCLIGLWHGNSPSVILRDARFPLYFAAFFLVVNFVERRHLLALFTPLLLVAAALVGLEYIYILEFVGAIHRHPLCPGRPGPGGQPAFGVALWHQYPHLCPQAI